MKHPPKLNSSRQDGAALIVGLILLAVATIVTLLSMSSGHMQERMTSNTNNQAHAFNAAEAGSAKLFHDLNSYLGGGGQLRSDEDLKEALNAYDFHTDEPRANDDPEFGEFGFFRVNLTESSVGESESRIVVDGYSLHGGSVLARASVAIVLESVGGMPFGSRGAFECIGEDGEDGEDCVFKAPSGGASSAADGRDYVAPHPDDLSQPNACDTQGGAPDRAVDDQGENLASQAGLILPEGDVQESSGGGGELDFEGDPSKVRSEEDYEERYGESLEDRRSYIGERIAEHKANAMGVGESGEREITDQHGTWVAEEGETLKLDGDAGGIVILDGGELDMDSGNQCFSGLVLVRDGGRIRAGGTGAILGSVVGAKIDGPMTHGNVSFFYSSEALGHAGGGGGELRISSWSEFLN
ncbi:PilX N-terminal domain-containing pilus assembly protein [Thioalkalivibrio sp. ALE19]|uniref:pilus assembly PilX family protein n=1 Tax=Thioalkalivibrio sp. ALE19 TaxID=1266909 RepID=UPI0018CAFC90|nr:pilus assembly PilX N-terminal domain-containing protein [Thioalkalivibrio sp. ALE19]